MSDFGFGFLKEEKMSSLLQNTGSVSQYMIVKCIKAE
jgi:hypothetical protein